MNASAAVYALRWLITDTFRQALATRIFWIMLAVSAVFIGFCLSVQVSGGVEAALPDPRKPHTHTDLDPGQGPAQLHLLFGAWKVDTGTRSPEDAVHFVQVVMATMVASYLGFLLVVLWTAGFLPEFLQPSAAMVLFAKPVPRWALLLGKYLGVVALVGFQVGVFFLGTWLALSFKTGIWRYEYLAAIPLLIINFAVIYSFGVLIAVLTRSAVACIFGCILFWVLCWGVNFGHHFACALPALSPGESQMSPLTCFFSQLSYWALPKPADMQWILQDALGHGSYFLDITESPGFKQAIAGHAVDKVWSLLSSVVFSILMLGISARHLSNTDY
jgi:ABC-type transport system involved in multi-copper enzyme maturation permease subunit